MPHLDSFFPLILIQLMLLQNPGFISKRDKLIRIQKNDTGIKANFGQCLYAQDALPLWQQLLFSKVPWYVIIFPVVAVFHLDCIRGQEHGGLRWTVYVIV